MADNRGPYMDRKASVYKVSQAIENCQNDEFDMQYIREITSFSKTLIFPILTYFTKQGYLIRTKRGVYKKVGKTKTNMPHGFVVEAIWQVLYKSRDIWLSLHNIVASAEDKFCKMKKPFDTEYPVDLYFHVSGIISYWYKNGYLQRTGQRRSYLYQLMPHVHTRPVVTHNKKTKNLLSPLI